MELWQGETNARGLEQRAAVTNAENKNRKAAQPLQYASTIIKGASSAVSIGADAGYWDPPKDAPWVQTTYGPDNNVIATEEFGGSKYSYKSIGG